MSESEMTGNILLFSTANAAATPTEASKPEAVLVDRIVAGDRDAFGELYGIFAPLVHGIILARVPRDEVDDLAQEIFLHALKKLHTLREAKAFGPWIAMIARNRAMDFHRSTRETVEVTEVDRWRGTKQVSERNSRGTNTRHVSTTYVKNEYEYQCRDCSKNWLAVRKEEL